MEIKVKQIINQIYPVSGNTFNILKPLLQYESCNKGETFIIKNKQNQKEYFLLDGICKSYLINPDGEEITLSFFMVQSVLSPNTSRTSDGISNIYFQALTDINLATVNAVEFQKLMQKYSDLRSFGQKVLEKELLLKVEKEIGFASLTAKERLLKLRKKYPHLENRISHKDIASYLGITNISLSRLRKELILS